MKREGNSHRACTCTSDGQPRLICAGGPGFLPIQCLIGETALHKTPCAFQQVSLLAATVIHI